MYIVAPETVQSVSDGKEQQMPRSGNPPVVWNNTKEEGESSAETPTNTDLYKMQLVCLTRKKPEDLPSDPLEVTLSPGVWDIEASATVGVFGAQAAGSSGAISILALFNIAGEPLKVVWGGMAQTNMPININTLRIQHRILTLQAITLRLQFGMRHHSSAPLVVDDCLIMANPANLTATKVSGPLLDSQVKHD